MVRAGVSGLMMWMGGYLGGYYSSGESGKRRAYECGFSGVEGA